MQAVDYSPLPVAPQRYRIDRTSVTHQILFAWFDMRRSTRRLITQRPSEEFLFLLLVLSNLAFFLSWTIKAVLVPRPESLGGLSTEVSALFLVAMLGRTVVFYAGAMFLGAFLRIMGGRGTWRNTRVALFWAAFVTAPFSVLAAIVSVTFAHLEKFYPIFGADWIALPPYWFGIIPFVWYLSHALTQAHGIRKAAPVFLYLSLATLAALLFTLYLRANGVI